MNRWSLSISTTAGVVLATTATYVMFQDDRFAMAGLALFFAFSLPLYLEAMRDKLLKRDSEMGGTGKILHEPSGTQDSRHIGH